MVREAIAMRIALQPDLFVCGEAAGQVEALALCKKNRPDLVLLDIKLRDGDGIELIKLLKSQDAPVQMLVLSAYADTLYAERALRAGASGYLNKRQPLNDLIEAVYSVLSGQRYMSSEITSRLVGRALGGAAEYAVSPVERLSDRELTVFKLVGQEIATALIAEQLHLSVHTIDTHRENIKRKLELRNATELSRYAFQWLRENG